MKGIVMKLSDVIMEVQNTLECERKSYDEGACQDENIKGWIEALEYTQGLLNKIKSINNKSLTKEDALETIINTHEKKIENLKQVLDWFDYFADAIQTWDHKLYNNACKYADEVEEECI